MEELEKAFKNDHPQLDPEFNIDNLLELEIKAKNENNFCVYGDGCYFSIYKIKHEGTYKHLIMFSITVSHKATNDNTYRIINLLSVIEQKYVNKICRYKMVRNIDNGNSYALVQVILNV
jgi:hypothetical protein